MLTAAHCFGRWEDFHQPNEPSTLGVCERRLYDPYDKDVATLDVREDDNIENRLAGGSSGSYDEEINEILSIDYIKEARPQMEKQGRTTGRTGGPVNRVEDNKFWMRTDVAGGDSGSPMFRVKSLYSDEASLGGILAWEETGGNDAGGNYAEWIENEFNVTTY